MRVPTQVALVGRRGTAARAISVANGYRQVTNLTAYRAVASVNHKRVELDLAPRGPESAQTSTQAGSAVAERRLLQSGSGRCTRTIVWSYDFVSTT